MNFNLSELLRDNRMALIVIGSLLLLLAAIGNVPIGNEPSAITDVVLRYIIAGIGSILIVVGTFLVFRGHISNESGKSVKHYVLFWWATKDNWAIADWKASQEYIGKFQLTAGFSIRDAQNANLVTIIGASRPPQEGPCIDEDTAKALEKSGCKVERIGGQSEEDTAQLLGERVRSNRPFKGN